MIEDDHLEFLHAVWTRRPTFTYIFFGLNLVVFVLMALAGGSMNEDTLMAFGVKANSAIAQGQWWRFVTPIFIHIGMLHLIFNSYALWIVGPQVEKLYGGARFVILYVLTGIAGVAGSYFYHPDTPSAGASGAIFGLFGVLLAFGIRYRSTIPPFFKRAVGTGVLPVIVINLVIGFTLRSFVDNSAHISGLLAGVVLGYIIPFQEPGTETPRVFEGLQIALLMLIALCFYEVGAHYDGPHLSVRNLGRGFSQILTGGGSANQGFIDAINNAQTNFEQSVQELESGRTDHLASLKAETAKSIDQLRKAPSLAATADQLVSDFLRLLQDQYDLIQEVERTGTITLALSRRLKENADRYEKFMARFSKWVETDGPRYGIQMGKDR
jgi:membrane associated rhomboid family serine protease